MIEIDGSEQSGSGTIVRYGLALATLTREPLRIIRIRAKRPKPGLRPQHLSALQACCTLGGGRAEGAHVGSTEMTYWPGAVTRGGDFRVDIGTAGSATLAALTLIPSCLFASSPCRITITGGLFQDFAPSFFHTQRVLVPLLGLMGAGVRMEMIRAGYFPKGGGEIRLEVQPMKRALDPLSLVDQGAVSSVEGIALASHLKDRKVAERMAERARGLLHARGLTAELKPVEDSTAVQSGAVLVLWARTDRGCLLGSDQAGKPRRRSEAIADFVVKSLLEDLDSGATTDHHAADQLILFGALAKGTTRYRIPLVTDHVTANRWLVEKILRVQTRCIGNLLEMEGMGYST